MVPYEASKGDSGAVKSGVHPEATGGHPIGYIEIDEQVKWINNSTWLYIHQAVESFKISKPLFVILKLNTPGGKVWRRCKFVTPSRNWILSTESP